MYPYNGLNEWFDVGREIFIVQNSKQALDIYMMLLNDDELRIRTGQLARLRVIKEHSTKIRAQHLVDVICKLKQ